MIFIGLEKKFPFFKLISTDPQEKSCLSKWFTIFHMLSGKILSPIAFVTESTSIYLQNNRLLLSANISSKLSTINKYFKDSHILHRWTLVEFSKFPISSISIPSSSSSTITILTEGFFSSIKTWFSLKIKLQKSKNQYLWT